MLARNQYLLSIFGNQVKDELTTGGVNNIIYTRGFVFMSLRAPAAGKITWMAWSLMVQMWGPRLTSRPLSSSNTISSSQEYTSDCTATYNVAYTVDGDNYELIVKDLAISFSGGTSFSE